MPSRSQLPGEIKRRKFLKALQKLGFIINTKGGHGSHIKIIWPKNQKSVTVPKDIRKDVLYYLLKEIEVISDITWEDIKKHI
ncbi:MAG: hypothetical protein A2458_02255 [Candidatus Kerfeldbacteria bacterium RIFOXYC2_FULL_38_9]|uniref:Addiction module toxin, HicA family n=1 Tax=Candidatus Kerfeldbacteria bacterium RIFOXYB2_FULL_38_14 TaxID=1798547 RepID=A0A1G2BBA9_9BACT|nr:MAG: hypothetical protein A2319_01960 [Candidatus Kerfeldbacteria bacterium RIFOXYB2_FULL_38_14]OGY90300.1 MAG: hypothetical protein A2458_02255 [Candidatus Kerfeldbacteria bacterium RIFOXYC2_FULL_38_9]